MRRSLAILAAIFVLFLAANRKSWLGYFDDDDLDNIGWNSQSRGAAYVEGLLTPRFDRNNFRPAGHLYYHAVEKVAGLRFAPYLGVLQLLNLANIALIFWLAKRFKLGETGAVSAALFFAFHPALFDAWWRPMYVFDVVCTLFSLLAMVAWSYRRWVLSFVGFWLAYKAKEPAILLPAVLLAQEMWMGDRKWKRLLPFFAVSAMFGIQALAGSAGTSDDYSLSFRPADLRRTIAFYSSAMLVLPLSGLLTLLLPAAFRDRRVWIGIGSLWLLLLPVLALPRRQFEVYLYLPLIGLSLALGTILEKYRPAAVAAAFFALWIPATYLYLKPARGRAIKSGAENRQYVAALADWTRAHPATELYVYDGLPERLRFWGVEGVLRYVRGGVKQKLIAFDDPAAASALDKAAVLAWDSPRGRLDVLFRDGAPDVPYVDMRSRTPVWQLGAGWFQGDMGFRWSAPKAFARLARPPGARHFEVVLNLGADFLREAKSVRLKLRLNGQDAGEHEFREPGVAAYRFELPPGAPGAVNVELETPPFRPSNGDPRVLGAPVLSFGFVEAQ